ncbi:BREX-2 system adenine-specific DNA-methyltransferase PglX [Micromonospora sp. S4605]|uniref:BREX-2 system adenine-specific DNA-methyltransferase PglX n=1 Tax=Micromonospora sp. S4605 TaxID=1420897 RepID=UPI002105B385|nr:BREX-2 system adenine-specific DNA-methyltransferase PglX [Micromonospora sp. S4605]
MPAEPSRGLVWQAITNQVDRPGSESDWVTSADTPRGQLATYPWSLSGGGASDVMAALSGGGSQVLGRNIDGLIGFASFPGADEPYFLPSHWHRRAKTVGRMARPLATGEFIRDWAMVSEAMALAPYGDSGDVIGLDIDSKWGQHLWSMRQILRPDPHDAFGSSKGDSWWAWYRWIKDRYAALHLLSFASVATHGHFFLNRGGNVFNRHAPVIKLPEGASEDDHLRLLGVLNSSTACFWLKQVSYPKGGDPLGDEGARVSAEGWSDRYEFTGTKLQEFPLPSAYPLELSREVDGLAQRLATVTPAAVAASGVPTRERLYAAEREWYSSRARMIALQEELDWQVYALYGLLDDELTAPAGSVPELRLGERAFEIVLARKMRDEGLETQWFARHGSTPITELPTHWSDEYRTVVERRIAVIEGNRNIGLIERPECKRRWATEGWDAMQAKALRDWLLDRCEARELWYHHVDGLEQPRPLTTAQLADELRRDTDVLTVAGIYAPGQDLGKVIADLVADEHVPHLAALRYKDSGLAKRADWEHVWDLQRQEDALPDEAAKREFRKQIPVPPKYTSADFLKGSYWKHRGKLDVPKERFVSYPGASRDGDPSLLVGWAGWDHREQAQALATLIVAREQEDGWAADRLLPLVAGLREILPWVRQWHGEFDPLWGASPADIYAGFLAETTNRLHLTDEALTSWRPPRATRGRKAKG